MRLKLFFLLVGLLNLFLFEKGGRWSLLDNFQTFKNGRHRFNVIRFVLAKLLLDFFYSIFYLFTLPKG